MLRAVEIGLDFLDAVGMEAIHDRVRALSGWFLEEVVQLRQGNGGPLARLSAPLGVGLRGGTVALNLCDREGRHLDHRLVEEEANAWGISLRRGCFCNPGADALALGLDRGEILACLWHSDNRMTLDEFRQCIDGKSTGAVRISFGLASTFADALTVLRFMEGFRRGPGL